MIRWVAAHGCKHRYVYVGWNIYPPRTAIVPRIDCVDCGTIAEMEELHAGGERELSRWRIKTLPLAYAPMPLIELTQP